MTRPGTPALRPAARPALVAITTVSLLLGAAATGCSSGEETSGPRSSPTTVSPADARFVSAMQSLDRRGLRLSGLARTHAASPDVRALAARTAAMQRRELRALSDVRDHWDAMDRDSMPMMQDSASAGMPDGMVRGGHFAQLSLRHGPAFDRRFLALMRSHHRAMATAAHDLRAHGRDPVLRRMVARMDRQGRARLDQMAAMMRERR